MTGEERVGEIARMLGHGDDPVARQHAAELLKKGNLPSTVR